MKSKTKDLQPNERPDRILDDFDRKILSALSADARQTYAEIGQNVGLSAPAVHERVKRLRESGVLKGTTAVLDAQAIGKPFLAFVHVDTEGWGKSERMMTLRRFPEVEEMHSVAGDTGVVMKVRTRHARAMEHFLSQLYVLPGVRGTKSYVVLSTYLERAIQPLATEDWPEIPLPRD
ncbi:Lrp/AsnC family transcriptional regulator [Labrys neptuniae]|uniref:Lrp/AsnC family transcriptional regulator n=1 Tax=Labrys TaxID=204476 RepID=UPI002891F88B|nr:Lrp/AsnC family transcriptional regulator [Labrys neptuniae]MDT3377980.1 Lrp/AsnC family transcriptional regulator [Labrys neptuniae]